MGGCTKLWPEASVKTDLSHFLSCLLHIHIPSVHICWCGIFKYTIVLLLGTACITHPFHLASMCFQNKRALPLTDRWVYGLKLLLKYIIYREKLSVECLWYIYLKLKIFRLKMAFATYNFILFVCSNCFSNFGMRGHLK